jgi:hypothetical protein
MLKIGFGEFMKWAFGEELVHVATDGGSLAWSRLAEYAALGTVIDTFGIRGAGLPELASVHPDAIVANEAVMLLAAEAIDLPHAWKPFPDLDDQFGLIDAVVAEVMARRAMRDGASLNANLIGMVISFAVMGKEPEWRVEQPKFRMVEKAGRPAWFVMSEHIANDGRVYRYETDGYSAKAGRPKRGAYRKYEISEPFMGAVQARIDWYLWSRAISIVSARLQQGLKSHQVTPPMIDCEIWKKSGDFAGQGQAVEIAHG